MNRYNSNQNLELRIGALLWKVKELEIKNKCLVDDNLSLREENNALSAKLIAAELKLTGIEDDVDSVYQKSLLGVPAEASEDVLGFVQKYAKEIGCDHIGYRQLLIENSQNTEQFEKNQNRS
jgi:regulator of replication initiation timing